MFHEVKLFLATAEAAGAIVLLVTDRRVSQDELGRARVFRVTEASGGGTQLRHHYQQKVQHMPRVTG